MVSWNQEFNNSNKGTIMGKYLLLTLLFVFWNITILKAQSNYVVGEGRFKSEQNESLGFIKEQLKHEAFLNIISKELDFLQLNADLFWQKYQEKLDDNLSLVDEDLKKRYKIGTDQETIKLRDLYVEKLREKRLKKRLRFGNLHRVIRSYAIKRMSRSSQNPKVRFIKLEAKVDRDLLSKFYYKFVQGKKSSDFGSLFVNVEYELENCSYTDIGVDNKSDFTSVVNEHWLEWLSKNKPKNIANIEILDEDRKSKLKEYQSLPIEKLLESIPEVFENSLLLNIKVVIDQKSINPSFKEYEFSYKSDLYLQDLQTNKILMQKSIPLASQRYSGVKKEDLSSRVANHVYRIPLGEFSGLKKVMSNIPPVNLTRVLSLFDYHNLKDVNRFMKLVEQKGIKYSLTTNIVSISSNKAEVAVHFDGEVKDLKRLLSASKSAKKDLSFELIDSDNTLGIKFN